MHNILRIGFGKLHIKGAVWIFKYCLRSLMDNQIPSQSHRLHKVDLPRICYKVKPKTCFVLIPESPKSRTLKSSLISSGFPRCKRIPEASHSAKHKIKS